MRISDWSSDVCSSDLLLRVDQEVATHDLGVGIAQHGGAARVADHLLGALAHAVALAGKGRDHLARAGNPEALLRPGLVLQFGHFASFLNETRQLERVGMPLAGPLNSRTRGYRSEEHTSELQSLMRISYAVFCLKK